MPQVFNPVIIYDTSASTYLFLKILNKDVKCMAAIMFRYLNFECFSLSVYYCQDRILEVKRHAHPFLEGICAGY